MAMTQTERRNGVTLLWSSLAEHYTVLSIRYVMYTWGGEYDAHQRTFDLRRPEGDRTEESEKQQL